MYQLIRLGFRVNAAGPRGADGPQELGRDIADSIGESSIGEGVRSVGTRHGFREEVEEVHSLAGCLRATACIEAATPSLTRMGDCSFWSRRRYEAPCQPKNAPCEALQGVQEKLHRARRCCKDAVVFKKTKTYMIADAIGQNDPKSC